MERGIIGRLGKIFAVALNFLGAESGIENKLQQSHSKRSEVKNLLRAKD